MLASYSGTTHVDRFDVGATEVTWIDLTSHLLYTGTGGAPSPVPLGAAPFTRPNGLVLLDDARHRITLLDSDFAGHSAAISWVAIDGSSAQLVATLGDGITAVTQDSSAIYFTTYGNDTKLQPPFSAVYKLAK